MAIYRSPLHEVEAARGARFGQYHSWEIVEDYGYPRREYDAVRAGAGALDLSHVGKVRVLGRDRVRYLHSMVSNDIKKLAPGQGCYAALLTHQGRMESDLYVYAFADELWLECPAVAKARVLETLNKYIVADVVTVEDMADKLTILSLQGRYSQRKMADFLGIPLDGQDLLQHRMVGQSQARWVAVRRDRTGYDGYDLWLPRENAASVWRQWVESEGIAPVGYQALNWLRTEAGIPWFGVDMDDSRLPMEMGLDSLISMTKGCYRGQEIVARVTYRGHLDRRLGGIALDAQEPPPNGADVRSRGARIGEVTSAIIPPRLGRPMALAILKLDFLKPGTAVDVQYGETIHRGEVIAVPLRD